MFLLNDLSKPANFLATNHYNYNMSKGVTPQSKDYAAWYTDIIIKAGLAAVSYTHLTLPTSDLV